MDEQLARSLAGRIVLVGSFDPCVVDAMAEAFGGSRVNVSPRMPPVVLAKSEWEAVYLPAHRQGDDVAADVEPFLLVWRVKDSPDTAGEESLMLLDAFARIRCEARLRCPILMVVYVPPCLPLWKQSSDEYERPTGPTPGSYFWIHVLEIGNPDLIRLRVRPECVEPMREELSPGDILTCGHAAHVLRARLHRVEVDRAADAPRCLTVLRTYRFLLEPWAPADLVRTVDFLLASGCPSEAEILATARQVWEACDAESQGDNQYVKDHEGTWGGGA